MASLRQTYSGETSVSVLCSGLDTSFNRTRYFFWQIYSGTTLVQNVENTSSAYASSRSVTFTGLTPDSSYSVLCGIYDDANYTILLASLSLYDVVTAEPTYTLSATISFDANGGTGAPSSVGGRTTSTSTSGYVSITFPSTVPTLDGYTFSCWLLQGYTTNYYPGYTYSIYATASGQSYTAVAQWEQSGAVPHIYSGGKWHPATPYVYTGSAWVKCNPQIYPELWG